MTIVVATAVGLVLLYEGIHLGFFHGQNEVDDGVYFGEGIMLAHGLLPYRTYLDVQPPGMAILMLPFGLVGRIVGERVAFELARLFVVCVAVTNVGLLGRLIRGRDWLGLLCGLVILGFYYDSFISEHTVFLEPILVLGTLTAFNILFDRNETLTTLPRRWLFAGIVLGCTTSIKLWEVLVVIVLLLLAARTGRRNMGRLALGWVVGFGAVCLPFFVVAPSIFIEEVIFVQLTRSGVSQSTESFRLWSLLGVPPGHITSVTPLIVPLLIWVIVVGAIVLITYSTARDARLRPVSDLEVCAVAGLLVVGLTFAFARDYYAHYGGFFAPFLALALSATVVRVARYSRRTVGVVVAAGVLGYALFSTAIVAGRSTEPFPTSAIDRVFTANACVISRVYAPLILANRFNIFEPRCPHILDTYGTELNDGNGVADLAADARSERVQADWLGWLRRVDGVVLLLPVSRNPDLGFGVIRYVQNHFSLAAVSHGLYIYRRSDS